MASAEHQELTTYIKTVHQTLRDDSETFGPQIAWQLHCSNDNKLKRYAFAMQHLATKYWEVNCNKANSKAISRVEWVFNTCCQYFIDGGMLQLRKKDQEIANKLNLQLSQDDLCINNPLKLLDVGSCYNPFKIYNIFQVIPIDIAPANSEVLKCDFLTVQIAKIMHITHENEVLQLEENLFDVIVFSLLLEYLPSTEQRHLCCKKAYSLLKTEGLFIIITPDSKHVGANAKLMKSWQHFLAKIGFTRIRYEKLPHLHCMAFRKSLKREISQRWSDIYSRQEIYTEMYIPQDFNKSKRTVNQNEQYSSCDTDFIKDLPFCDSDFL